MEWRCIDTGYTDAYTNMAIDELLLNSVSENKSLPILRFYGWSTPSISLGYFQKINDSIDVDFCDRNSVNIVRRLTGGRTVLHDMELTYSVVIPEANDFATGSVTETYGKISMGLLEGLKLSGINAEFSNGIIHQSETSACFEVSARYEIVLKGKKLVGSAQTRKKGVLLQHGSILLNYNYDLFAGCLGLKDEKKENFIRSFKEKATNIKDETGSIVEREILVKNIMVGFEKFAGVKLCSNNLSESENFLLEELRNKYFSKSWNWLR